MRKGENISKGKQIQLQPCAHRVIIPLYIPEENGYYLEAFKIFEMCLFSLFRTSYSELKVTVISDGCCSSVNRKLYKLHREGHINELILESENIGKINAILKTLRTVDESLVTITDADILFLKNWEKEVFDVFKYFPKAGAVCPIPIFRTHFKFTSNIWVRYLFSKKLKFLPVKNTEALTRFANSIGWPWLDEKWKDSILTLKGKQNKIAVVGCSHLATTYKTEVFKHLPAKNAKFKLGGDSMDLYLDKPVLKSNSYRLATYNNYAYHMGNKLESWMLDEYKNLKENSKNEIEVKFLKKIKTNSLNYFLSETIFKKLLYIKGFKRQLLKLKGLNNEQVKNYIS